MFYCTIQSYCANWNMSDHLADEIERMNTRWMPLVAERLWLCSQADSQVALRRRVMIECSMESFMHTDFRSQFICIDLQNCSWRFLFKCKKKHRWVFSTNPHAICTCWRGGRCATLYHMLLPLWCHAPLNGCVPGFQCWRFHETIVLFFFFWELRFFKFLC